MLNDYSGFPGIRLTPLIGRADSVKIFPFAVMLNYFLTIPVYYCR